MRTNKDTKEAQQSVKNLIKYCGRYPNCTGCTFRKRTGGCFINYPFSWAESEELSKKLGEDFRADTEEY